MNSQENKEKCYLVSHGEYSDYYVAAVFAKKEDAENYVKLIEGSTSDTDYQIEESEMNPDVPISIREGYSFYSVRMFRDGNLREPVPNWGIPGVQKTSWIPKESQLSKAQIYKYSKHYDSDEGSEDYKRDGELIMDITVRAKDEKHAVKIANEKRIMLIANNLFNEGYNEYTPQNE